MITLLEDYGIEPIILEDEVDYTIELDFVCDHNEKEHEQYYIHLEDGLKKWLDIGKGDDIETSVQLKYVYKETEDLNFYAIIEFYLIDVIARKDGTHSAQYELTVVSEDVE